MVNRQKEKGTPEQGNLEKNFLDSLKQKFFNGRNIKYIDNKIGHYRTVKTLESLSIGFVFKIAGFFCKIPIGSITFLAFKSVSKE